ncbi:flavodoxin domain-containing protein [Lentisphaera profundi]|uniref:Flavodoxin domain-containing protein n=1 Tax=Lentisphaera profundi TaxID=1658616 RepID=A0ABY7VQY7_9BACT|nr:NAD(P)H-dependent oxidoreductase [Lentisphaera profundi]WDE95199.1 flavodoxin domain-containing protein [Lentisphaera profundi]
MSNILVLYHSRGGNTKIMANTIAAGASELEGTTVRVLSTDEASFDDLKWCDGIALGSPTNYGTISGKMKCWWDELPPSGWGSIDGKIGCAFSSSGAWGGGAELTCMTLMTILMNYGFLTFGVTDYVDQQFSPHYGSISASSPDEERVQKSCHRLGRRLAEWASTLINGRQDHHPLKQDYKRFNHKE